MKWSATQRGKFCFFAVSRQHNLLLKITVGWVHSIAFYLGTIHLIRRQFFMIFNQSSPNKCRSLKLMIPNAVYCIFGKKHATPFGGCSCREPISIRLTLGYYYLSSSSHLCLKLHNPFDNNTKYNT